MEIPQNTEQFSVKKWANLPLLGKMKSDSKQNQVPVQKKYAYLLMAVDPNMIEIILKV